MRFKVAVAVGVAMFVAGASAASATSLSGTPIKLLSGGQPPLDVSAFRNSDGGFGAVVAKALPDRSMEVYLQLYNAKGKRKGERTAVINRFPPVDRARAGDALPLADGRTLVGYSSVRFSMDGIENRYFGQVVSDGATSGEPVDLAPTARFDLYFGRMIQLADGRGLAYWSSGTDFWNARVEARFVSQAGEPAQKIIDLTRKASLFSYACPFANGFLVQYLKSDGNRASVFARMYDAAGKQKGAEAVLEDKAPYRDAVGAAAMGLLNGDIVVFRSVKSKNGAKFSAQLHDGSLKPKGKPKVLAKTTDTLGFAAQPLAGGDFVIGVKVTDGEADQALEYSRFGPDLKQVGASARISGVAKPEFVQTIGLDNGNIVAVYRSNASEVFGQIIKP